MSKSRIWGPPIFNKDSVIDIGKKIHKSEEYMQLSISADDLSQFPSLLNDVKKAIACHYGQPNNHVDFLQRVNALPSIKSLVHKIIVDISLAPTNLASVLLLMEAKQLELTQAEEEASGANDMSFSNALELSSTNSLALYRTFCTKLSVCSRL